MEVKTRRSRTNFILPFLRCCETSCYVWHANPNLQHNFIKNKPIRARPLLKGDFKMLISCKPCVASNNKNCERVILTLQLAICLNRHRYNTSCKEDCLVYHGLNMVFKYLAYYIFAHYLSLFTTKPGYTSLPFFQICLLYTDWRIYACAFSWNINNHFADSKSQPACICGKFLHGNVMLYDCFDAKLRLG